MNRRQFLKALGMGGAALAMAPLLPAAPAPRYVSLAFHPDAFALSMAPLETELILARYITPAVVAMREQIDRGLMEAYFGYSKSVAA